MRLDRALGFTLTKGGAGLRRTGKKWQVLGRQPLWGALSLDTWPKRERDARIDSQPNEWSVKPGMTGATVGLSNRAPALLHEPAVVLNRSLQD